MSPKAKLSTSASAAEPELCTHWLMKAEPDTRIEKGKDVKFSVDDLKQMGTSPWDGVRNHQAKGFMKDKMKIGHQVLFYHSNTKVPGVYGLAEVTKEGYADASAFDTSHPYYDPKSKPDFPTWFLVDVTYVAHLSHPVTLALLKHMASLSSSSAVHSLGVGSWFDDSDLSTIKSLPLITRGRLSVQPVPTRGYEIIKRMGEEGGWSEEVATGKKIKALKPAKAEAVDGEGAVPGRKTAAAASGGDKNKRKSAAKEEIDEGEVKTEEVGAAPPMERRKSARLK